MEDYTNKSQMKRVAISLFERIALFVAVLALAFSCEPSTGGLETVSPEAVGMNSAKLSQIDREVALAISEGDCPGAVVCVVRGDKIAYLKAYGSKQIVPERVPMTPETVFDLASCSKCVGTTLAFMQLVENGYCRLSDKVKMYIPDFKPWTDPKTGKKTDITIENLLTHTSGVDAYIDVAKFRERFGDNQPDSLIRYIATETGRAFRPGSDYLYSCLNFVTLQNILQNITGEKLCDYAQTHVFDVLGLESTCYRPAETRPDLMPRIAPTEVQEDGLPLRGVVHDPLANHCNAGNSGNAGVFSSSADLAVICAAIMNGGELKGRRILSPLAVEAMARVPSGNDPSVGRALGWDNHSESATLRGDLFSRCRTICHTGYTGPSIVIDMEARTAVIILANRVHPKDDGSLARLRARISNIVAGSIEK